MGSRVILVIVAIAAAGCSGSSQADASVPKRAADGIKAKGGLEAGPGAGQASERLGEKSPE